MRRSTRQVLRQLPKSDCGTFLTKTNLVKAPEANSNKRVLEEENTDDEADALMALSDNF